MLKEGGILQSIAERGTQDQKTPRVECALNVGAVIQRNKLPTGLTERRERPADRVRVCARVYRGDGPHPQRSGAWKIRGHRPASWPRSFSHGLNARLPYHFFVELEESGTTSGMQNGEALEEDISQIRYAGQLAIRSTAWPAGV